KRASAPTFALAALVRSARTRRVVTVGSPAIRELRVDVRSHHRRHGRRIARFEARESSTFTPHEDCTFRHLRLTEIGNAISRHPFLEPHTRETPTRPRRRAPAEPAGHGRARNASKKRKNERTCKLRGALTFTHWS